MTYIKYYLILREVKYGHKGNSQLYRSKIRSQMASVFGYGIKDLIAKFIAKALSLCLCKFLYLMSIKLFPEDLIFQSVFPLFEIIGKGLEYLSIKSKFLKSLKVFAGRRQFDP